jgi:hypothetical protein
MNQNELSDKEKKIRDKHIALFERMRIVEERFWQFEYPNKTFSEKVQHWLEAVHRGMRSQGEAINDEYSEFSFKWYQWVKEKEPEFDNIFKEVVKRLGFDFNWDEYNKRIAKS